jgi:hypothetical protein
MFVFWVVTPRGLRADTIVSVELIAYSIRAKELNTEEIRSYETFRRLSHKTSIDS